MFVKGKREKPGNALSSIAVTCLRERRAAGRKRRLGVAPQIPDEMMNDFAHFMF